MINYNKKKQVFYIHTKETSYIFGVSDEKRLYHAYYGKKISGKELAKISEPKFKEIGYHSSDNKRSNFMPEINIYDGYNVFENTIKASMSDGVRSLDCVYAGHKISEDTLEVTLKDKIYKLQIILLYKIYPELNLIEKSLAIKNNEKKLSLTLESFNSGDMILPAGKYNLGFFHGGWIKEMSLRFEEISHGKKVLESRTGNSSHILNPSFFITKDEKVSEDTGEYYFGQLLWSGNWKFTFEKRLYDIVTFTGGVNSFDGFVTLRPGTEFKAPSLLLGFTDKGTGQMSRNLHDFYRQYMLPKQNLKTLQRVLVNSWEAFYFDLNEEKLLKLAEIAVNIGAELLVVDDGWFRGRNDDTSSLGDWEPAVNKFPGGMIRFTTKIKAKNLLFGIWMEPEMVNPNSNLYKKHPDWCYHFEGRPRTEMRHQLVLNITKKEVMDYLKKAIHRVITEFDPDYVKWDMNRYISEAGASNLKDTPVWIEHMKAAYELMAYMRSLKPSLIIEGCAGGGGRFSGGMFSYVDQMWTSDNNDPFCRQYIQYGTSLFYPAQVMCCHVGDSPYGLTGRESSLMFRVRTAMAGNFGIEANLLKWNRSEQETIKNEIALYKSIREIIYRGDLYRIESPYGGSRVSFMYVSKDKTEAVLFAFIINKEQDARPGDARSASLQNRIKLKGLDPEAKYEIETGGKKSQATGAGLMTAGLEVSLEKEQDSRVIKINKI
jgi:alpha-galactosidase